MTGCLCGCGATVPYTRGAKYATKKCRDDMAKYKRDGVPGVVASRRTLKSGKVSFIVHVLPIFAQHLARGKGEDVRLGSR